MKVLLKTKMIISSLTVVIICGLIATVVATVSLPDIKEPST